MTRAASSSSRDFSRQILSWYLSILAPIINFYLISFPPPRCLPYPSPAPSPPCRQYSLSRPQDAGSRLQQRQRQVLFPSSDLSAALVAYDYTYLLTHFWMQILQKTSFIILLIHMEKPNIWTFLWVLFFPSLLFSWSSAEKKSPFSNFVMWFSLFKIRQP